MRQIKMTELTEKQRIQYEQKNRKQDLKLPYFFLYVFPGIYLIGIIVIACVAPEDYNIVPVLVLAAAVTIAFVLIAHKKYLKIRDMYDALIEERVWECYIDSLQPNEEIEFVDKNSQTIEKTFDSEVYKKYINAGRIHVLYIPRHDSWYMRKGEA